MLKLVTLSPVGNSAPSCNLETSGPASPVPQGTGRFWAEIELRIELLPGLYLWTEWISTYSPVEFSSQYPDSAATTLDGPQRLVLALCPAPVLRLLPTLWENRAGLTKLPLVKSFSLPSQGLSSPCCVRPHLHLVPDPAAGLLLHSWGGSRLLHLLAVLPE